MTKYAIKLPWLDGSYLFLTTGDSFYRSVRTFDSIEVAEETASIWQNAQIVEYN